MTEEKVTITGEKVVMEPEYETNEAEKVINAEKNVAIDAGKVIIKPAFRSITGEKVTIA